VVVTDTAGGAVDGAEVVISALGLGRRADAAGRLVFESLPAADFVRANARTDAADCPPEMWVDGVRTFNATVDEFEPRDVEGIELYRGLGQIPAQYLSRTSARGLVIIWTRSPSRMPR
jgi:hypothetical protein